MADLITNSSPFLADLDFASLSASEQAQIDALITAGSQYLEKYLNRIFAQADYTDEIHDGNGWDSIFVDNPPINSLTDIDIISETDVGTTTTTHAASKFKFDPDTGEIRFKPATFVGQGGIFSEGFRNVQITYNGGFSAIPEPIKLLTSEFVIELFDPTFSTEGIEREKLGDYFYSKGSKFFEKLLFKKRKILDIYKIRKV